MAICLPGVLRTQIVTPSLAKKILTLEFRMTNPDDLSTGIQPFILVQTTAAEQKQAQDLVHVYDAVMSGATATVADAQFLVANDPALIPLMPGQARSCLTFLRALIMVFFNVYHPWAARLGTFLLDYTAREVQLETLQVRDPKYRTLGHALIVRYVQLPWSRWLLQQWSSPVPIPVPDLSELFMKIDLEQMWESTLPPQYLSLAPPLTPPPVPAALPAARLPPAARVPPPAPPAPAGPRSQTQLDNPDYLEGDFGAKVVATSLPLTSSGTPPAGFSDNTSIAARPSSSARRPGPYEMCRLYQQGPAQFSV
jgi:hypothetical protein